MGAEKENTHGERRPEGKEGANSHQEGNSVNDHQKTVSGKKQHGPEDKVGADAGGNEGSKGQNVDSRRSTGTGKQPGDIGDDRGRSRGAQ